MKRRILAVVFVIVAVLCGCADHVDRGIDLLESGKYKEAKEAFQKEITSGKHLEEAYRGLGIACYELQEYDNAIDALKHALENEAEGTATLYGMMGACYMEGGEYEKAVDIYNKALAMEDIDPKLGQEIRYNIIAAYEKMANWDAAKEQMKIYQELYPDAEGIEKESDFLETR